MSDEEKITTAIQIYFDLKARSFVQGEALDLGFVIDRSTEAGTDLYNYELGLLQYSLASWKYGGMGFTDCAYTCAYDSVEAAGGAAEVKLRLAGEYHYPETTHVDQFGEEPHAVSLVRSSDGWKLIADVY